jgi:hypothetical protein
LAYFIKNGHDGMRMATRQAADRANAATFGEQLDNLDSFTRLNAQPIKRLILRKSLSAFDTAITLDSSIAVFKTAKTLGFAVAANTRHLTLSRRGHKVTAFARTATFGL